MSFIDKILSSTLKMGMYEYCHLEAADDEHTLVTKDGGFVSFLQVWGSYDIIGHHKFPEAVETIYGRLAGNMRQPGHRLQFVFARTPESARIDIKKSTDLMRRTAERLRLDIQQVIDEKEAMMAEKVSGEHCYLVISTMPKALGNKSSVKVANKRRSENSKQLGVSMKPGEWGQSPLVAMDALRMTHRSFVRNIAQVFGQFVVLNIMDVHDAVRAIKMEICPETVSPDWRPTLIGDKIKPRLQNMSNVKVDASHVMYPEIAFQLFNRKPRVHDADPNLIAIGKSVVAPIIVDIPPIDPRPFSELFESIEPSVPWRFSMYVDSGHSAIMSKLSTRHAIASLLAFTTSHNHLIRDAAEELLTYGRNETLVSCAISLVTWGENVDEATHRKGILTQAVQSWGQCDTIEEKGDIIDSWCDTLPGFTKKPVATPYPEVFGDALRLLPFTRPASPWEKGTMLYRTLDNKLFPYQPFSSHQVNPSVLVFAPPGSGKSFYLNAANMGALLNPGNSHLPKIAIFDPGASSFSLIEYIKDALPKELRHMVQSFRMKMEPGMEINPFDTPLGCDVPLAIDRSYLINLMDLVLTPAGMDTVARLPELCGALVDEMYDYFSPGRSPKRYDEFVDDEVDEAIKTYGVSGIVPGKSTWQEVRDALFDKGLIHFSYLAHKQAMPTLQDATTVLSQSIAIQDLYSKATLPGSAETLVDFVNTALSSAIKSYPILGGASSFDTGGARIMAIDLRDVAQGNSASGIKMTNVCYLLARKLCSDYYRQLDVLTAIPDKYRVYHEKLIEQDVQVPKRICMDEFHVTKGSYQVIKQVEDDIRQGRKFNVGITLLSQELDDFTPTMVSLASNVYVFSKGLTEETPDRIRDKFGLSRDGDRMFRLHVTGPTPEEGSTFLYLGAVRGQRGRVEQVLRLTLGATERWAYSTTPEDMEIRRKLTARVGIGNALRILASEYPGGTAKDDVKRRMEAQSGNIDNVYHVMADGLIKRYQKIITKY